MKPCLMPTGDGDSLEHVPQVLASACLWAWWYAARVTAVSIIKFSLCGGSSPWKAKEKRAPHRKNEGSQILMLRTPSILRVGILYLLSSTPKPETPNSLGNECSTDFGPKIIVD